MPPYLSASRPPFVGKPKLFNRNVSCPNCMAKFKPIDEYVKRAWQATKMPEFRTAMAADVAEANRGITHADFVAGAKDGTMGFQCPFGEPYQFIRGAYRTIFDILVFLYALAPVILIPLWAWYSHDWWLLLGIVSSAIGTGTAAQLIYKPEKRTSVGRFLLVAYLLSWLTLGFHSCCTFFALCALWGFMLYGIADDAQKDYAMYSLVENPDLFNWAIAQNKIRIIRREGAGKGNRPPKAIEMTKSCA